MIKCSSFYEKCDQNLIETCQNTYVLMTLLFSLISTKAIANGAYVQFVVKCSIEMVTKSPLEVSVTISRSDNHVAGSSPSSHASQLDSVAEGRRETARSCDSIGGIVEEANAFIVNTDEDNFNEAERDIILDEHGESQHLLRNDRSRAVLNKDYGTLNHNETVNKFLQDIYDKEIDLNLRFSDLEINDIRDAVKILVNKLALKVGDVDERLKIADAILLGSAREGSQIVRPCEYDFALTLKYLSNANVVSLQPADTKDNSREYVHVSIEDGHIKTKFCELIDGKDARVLCSHWLPWYRESLRGIFDIAIKTAVQSTKYEVIMGTGILSLKNCEVKEHGPAFTVRLIWERATHGKTVDISVDLCPALKLAGVLDHNITYSLFSFRPQAHNTTMPNKHLNIYTVLVHN